jgi:hypothetical protein
MKSSIPTFFLCLFLGVTLAHGATVNIGPGESIQTAINNASAGDVLNLAAPVDYNGDLNITKPLRIVSSLTANQSIGGNIYIEGVTVGQSVTLKNLNLSGSMEIKDSSVNILKCSITSSVTALNPGNVNTQLNFVQSSIIGKLTSKMTRSWVGYSTLRQSAFEGVVEIVGNDFNGSGLGGIGIDINGSHSFANIHNNLVQNFSLNSGSDISNTCIGIRIAGNAKAEIRNNSIINNFDSSEGGNENYVGVGIFVESTESTIILSNLIDRNYVSSGGYSSRYPDRYVEHGHTQVYAPKTNLVVRYNALARNPSHNAAPELVKGGAEHYDTISDTAEGTGFLHNTVGRMDGKAGQDKGSPHDYHKDHDGSRNDIGANGGRNYIPDGRTTNKPIPIFFSLAPQAVPIGGTVTIESTGATVK